MKKPPKREKAVALEYDRRKKDQAAPVVTAKGEGHIARRIVETARAADVPVVEDAALVSALLSLELGQEIPADLYPAVARILSHARKQGYKNLAILTVSDGFGQAEDGQTTHGGATARFGEIGKERFVAQYGINAFGDGAAFARTEARMVAEIARQGRVGRGRET